MDDAARLALSFVAEHFTSAQGVVLAGSSAAGTATPTSDVDLLLIGPESMFDGDRSSLAAMYEHTGRLVEVFAYTAETFREWAGREVAAHRPVILMMLTEGVALREDDTVRELRRWAAATLETGPAVDPHDLDVRRYMVSAMLDDLTDAHDRGERALLLAQSFTALAELLLLADGRWIGSGKWLVRRLRAWDPALARDLTEPLVTGDVARFVRRADDVLTPLGGRLQAGMVR